MPGAPWMNVVNSWRSRDGCYLCLVLLGGMLLILGGPQMDAINAWCSLDECC